MSDVTRRGYGRTGRVRYRFFTAYGLPIAFLDHVATRFAAIEMNPTFRVEFLGEGSARWEAGRRSEYVEDGPQ